MDFQLSDDQELIRAAVRKICADYPDEYWAEKDEKHEFPVSYTHLTLPTILRV